MAIRKIEPSRTAIFICDVQEGFRKHIYGYEALVKTGDKVLTAAKTLGVPIIATEQNPDKLGKTVSEFDIKDAKLVLGKMKFSMVVPEVEKALKDLGTKSVVVFGIETHVCVLQTTFDLLERGYDVHLLADGCSSVNKGEIEIALNRARDAGAVVTTSESLLFQLMQDAGHEHFRTISKLVRDSKTDTVASLETLVLKRSSL